MGIFRNQKTCFNNAATLSIYQRADDPQPVILDKIPCIIGAQGIAKLQEVKFEVPKKSLLIPLPSGFYVYGVEPFGQQINLLYIIFALSSIPYRKRSCINFSLVF